MIEQYVAQLMSVLSMIHVSMPNFDVPDVVKLVGFLWMFWALYVFAMGIYRAQLAGRLKGVNFVLALPIVIVALAVDVITNLVIAPIVFLDVPRELLVTSRLIRYMAGPAGWRRTVAMYICDNMLDVFDPNGNHC